MSIKIHNRKLRAGALYYVIFICFVLSATVLFFIVLRSLKCRSIRIELEYYQKIDNINSALTLYLSMPESYQHKDSVAIFPLSDSTSQVKINKTYWGIYDKIKATTTYRGKILSRTILAGKDPTSSDSLALYVPDKNQTIYASGNTNIVGNIKVSLKGIQRASIEGKPLQSKEVFTGRNQNSGATLPNLAPSLIRKIKLQQNFDSLSQIAYSLNNIHTEVLNNPFSNQTTWLYSNSDIHLSEFQSDKNIGICSSGTILLSKETDVSNLILSASKFVIKDGVKGSMQIFAKDSIIIGSHCHLKYPTVICLYSENVNNIYVEVGDSTSIEGSIIVIQEYLAAKKPHLKVGIDTKITGQVYHKGTIELFGDIYGSLYCEDFYLKTSRAYYINHLLDNTIDFTKLPKELIISDFTSGYSNQIIDFIDEDI